MYFGTKVLSMSSLQIGQPETLKSDMDHATQNLASTREDSGPAKETTNVDRSLEKSISPW